MRKRNKESFSRREIIWCVLSDYIGGDSIRFDILADIDIKQLEDIFFNEVALHCGPPYLTTTPPMGEGFFHDEVVADIRAKLKNRNNSIFERMFQKAASIFWRYFFQEKWKSLVKILENYKQKNNG
jgi:hypothetical protein